MKKDDYRLSRSVILMRDRDKRRMQEERERTKARELEHEYAIGRRSFERILPLIKDENDE